MQVYALATRARFFFIFLSLFRGVISQLSPNDRLYPGLHVEYTQTLAFVVYTILHCLLKDRVSLLIVSLRVWDFLSIAR